MSQFMDAISGTAEWALLEAHWPGCAPTPVGVLLRDRSRDQLYVRMRPEWSNQGSEGEETELWRELAEDLEQQARERGADQVLEWLESTASHTLQTSGRREIPLTTASATLDHLYQQHVAVPYPCSEGVRPFRVFLHQVMTRLISREPHHDRRLKNWRMQAVLAATLLLTARWAGLPSGHTRFSRPTAPTKAQERRELPSLPLWAGVHEDPVLWRIDTEVSVPHSAPRLRIRKRIVASPPRKHFQIDHVVVSPRRVSLTRVDLLAPSIAFELRPAAWDPTVLQPLPVIKPYRTQRNKVIRVLAALATPLRFLIQ